MHQFAALMPEDIRRCFEQYTADPATTTAAERKQLKTYIVTYGRLKVLNAVPASRSQHLDALMCD